MRQRLAWALFLLTILVSVVHVALLVASPEPLLSTAVVGEGFPLVTLGAIAGAGIGALIVSRYPAHPVGWLFVVGQLFSELGVMFGVYGHEAVSGRLGDAPGGHVAVWLSIQAGGLFVIALLAIVFLLAPDGHLVSPRWRWALGVVVAGLAASFGGVLTVRPGRLDENGQLIGEMPAALGLVLVAASLAIAVGVLAGAAAVTVRLRRSSGDERQQLRWVALAAGAMALGVLANLVLVVVDAPDWLQSLPVMAAYACVPVFIGIAILRHRLFDIDVIINRAIVLGVLTCLVTVGYVGLVVLLSAVLPIGHGTPWLPFLATVLIALLFQPVREGAQRLADRLVYGSRAAPYLQLAEFSNRLQGAAGSEELLRQMEQAVAGAVGARTAIISVDVHGTGRSDQQPDSAGVVTVPVVEAGERLATLQVTMPPDRPLRAAEQRLLADFAVQLGTALRNRRLESDLADRVAELRASTEALEASAHRLRLAQETERQRFESDLRRTVVPHLRDVEAGLGSVLERSAVDAPVEPVLERLTVSTYSALEALRTLTRGVFPAQLTRQGLVPALTGYLERTGSGTLTAELGGARFDPRVESCAYFCVVEFVRAVGACAEVVVSTTSDGDLGVVVRAAGAADVGGAANHLEDRVAAFGGRLRISRQRDRAELTFVLPASVADDSDLVPHPAQ